MTCMISVFGRDALILIDSGATHSFISMGFISNVNVIAYALRQLKKH